MRETAADAAPFTVHGAPGEAGPIVVAVPHAGRCYPPELLARARVPRYVLVRLEDRLVDLLAHRLIAAGHCVLIAHAPRALIDLNRDEREIDTGGIAAPPAALPVQASAKVRGGLGLIPRRLAQAGELWRAPLPYAELRHRIETVHRPYHRRLADLLEITRARHGTALLLDLHSMPPLSHGLDPDGQPPRVVIGDRFGRSAAPRLSALALEAAQAHGLSAALNHPYPGSHILDRHGRPWAGVHAMQLEVDRSLYLDEHQLEAGRGIAMAEQMVCTIVEALVRELASWPRPCTAIAAE